MLSGMHTPENIIALALHGSLLKHPDTGTGGTWDRQFMQLEVAEHHARSIMLALQEAGFEIVKARNA